MENIIVMETTTKNVLKSKSKLSKPKNKWLTVTGILATIDLLLLLIPLFILSIFDLPMLARAIQIRSGLTIFMMVLVPHLGSILVFQLGLLLLAAGGFTRNNIICFIGTLIYSFNFTVTRLFHGYSDAFLNMDFLRFYHEDFVKVFSQVARMNMNSSYYSRTISLVAVVFISLAFLMILVVMIMKAIGVQGKTMRTIGIILGCVAVAILAIACFGDIIHLLNVNQKPISLTEKMSYARVVGNTLRQFNVAIRNGDHGMLTPLAPLMNILRDFAVVIIFGTTTLTSVFSIPKEKIAN